MLGDVHDMRASLDQDAGVILMMRGSLDQDAGDVDDTGSLDQDAG